MAELEKLLCSDSKVETLKKINAIIDNIDEPVNKDLSNLSEVGQTKFDEKADINLSNLTATAQAKFDEKAYANEVLKKTQITNCITENPQNIKLELADGVLTLKAGSKVIVPNGVNNFEHKSNTSDLSRSAFGTQSGENIYIELVVNKDTLIPTGLTWSTTSNTVVGTTAPSSGVFYDTANNEIYQYTSAGKQDRRCLPIALVKMESGVVTEITQVFNGMGYFGNTMFADKGIKGLIPNGRNADGTLNNIEFVTSKVLVHNDTTGHDRQNQVFVLTATTFGIRSLSSYLENENYNYNGVTKAIEKVCVAGKFSKTATQVTMLDPKQPFRAVDYNEYKSEIDTKVNKTGDTMTGNFGLQKSDPRLYVYSNDITQGQTPTATEYASLLFGDKNKKLTAQVNSAYNSDGSVALNLTAYTKDGSANTSLKIGYDANGNIFTSAPTPPTGDNSAKIATTAWVNNEKATICGWGMPSTKYTNLTLGEAQSTYTAPANGYFQLSANATKEQGFICLRNDNGSGLQTIQHVSTSDNWCSGFLPVKKGDVVFVDYMFVSTTDAFFRFIYAEGAK